MSKPSKNRVWCPDCGRPKTLFETEAKAKNFIKWNGDDIDTKGSELRVYYCPSCCGYHISSKPHKYSYDHQTEHLINSFKTITNDNIYKIINKSDSSIKEKKAADTGNLIIEQYMKDVDAKSMTKKYIVDVTKQYAKEHEELSSEAVGLIRKYIYKLYGLNY